VTASVLLAVDGGRSKTDVALLSPDGSLLAAVRGPGSSPHYLGLDGSMRLVRGLVESARDQAGIAAHDGPIATIGAWFMAGADLPAEERALLRALDRLAVAARNHVANDTFAILRAGADQGWGVAVVTGSGINCVGLAPNGRTARFLALGDITGDWGGGSEIGLAALGAAVRAEDGRGPATALREVVASQFGVRRATDVAIEIHAGRIDREQLRELAPTVVKAAAGGDAMAIAILERQADEVVTMASAAIRRLRLTRADVTVVLGGSVLAAVPPTIIDRIEAGVRAIAPLARCVVCRDRPIVGAALTVLDLGGTTSVSSDRVRRALSDRRLRAPGSSRRVRSPDAQRRGPQTSPSQTG
jgi:N-acetylglucosamine kinase-like BadF-type ATPase